MSLRKDAKEQNMSDAEKKIWNKLNSLEKKMKTTVTNGDDKEVELGKAITQIWNDIAIIRDINKFWQLLKRRRKIFIGTILFVLLVSGSAGIDFIINKFDAIAKIIMKLF